MWKLFTGALTEKIYSYMETIGIFLVEKGCQRKLRETKFQLLTDKMVLKDDKKVHTNLVMACFLNLEIRFHIRGLKSTWNYHQHQ